MHLPELALMLSAVVTISIKENEVSRLGQRIRLTSKLVVEVDKLTVVDLFQEELKFLGFAATLDFVNSSNTIINVASILGNAHLRQLLQAL